MPKHHRNLLVYDGVVVHSRPNLDDLKAIASVYRRRHPRGDLHIAQLLYDLPPLEQGNPHRLLNVREVDENTVEGLAAVAAFVCYAASDSNPMWGGRRATEAVHGLSRLIGMTPEELFAIVEGTGAERKIPKPKPGEIV